MAENTNQVDTTCKTYNEMASKWELLHDLLGGTKAMRSAGQKWLPKESAEQMDTYQNRVNRTILFGAYKDTIAKLANKPFVKPVTFQGGELPEQLMDIETNADGVGRDITKFACDVFNAALNYGITHILVDYPTITNPLSLKAEKDMRLRPIFVHIRPCDLIGWQSQRADNGTTVLTQIRFKENVVESDGEYGEKDVERIRVYTRDKWEIHERTKEGKYVLKESGLHTFRSVPLVTLYLDENGFMSANPPFEDLAWLNLAHWQSSSDQRNILRFTRLGLLFFKGVSETEQKSIIIAPNTFVASSNENADGKFIESSGQGLQAGKEDLEHLEEQMEVLGMQPMISRAANVKATGQIINAEKSESAIQTWIRGLETAIEQCYEYAAQWIKVPLPDDFNVDIFSDFGITSGAAADTQALISMRQAGDLSRETFLREVKRRGLLSDSLIVEDEIRRIGEEGPDLGSLGEGETGI